MNTLRERLIRWRYLGAIPLSIAWLRMEVGCYLRGHDWQPLGAVQLTCDRCLRTIGEPTPEEQAEAKRFLDEIIDDFFAFQVAACTARPDCGCGRPADHPAHQERR